MTSTWWAETAPVVPPHNTMAGASSASWRPPSTDTAVQPTSVPGASSVCTEDGDVLQCPLVGSGHEQHRQVGRFAEALEQLAHHLAGGLGGERVLREGGGEGHGS